MSFFNFLNNDAENIALNSASGELKVYKQENFLQLDFPKDSFKEVDMIKALEMQLEKNLFKLILEILIYLLCSILKILFQT